MELEYYPDDASIYLYDCCVCGGTFKHTKEELEEFASEHTDIAYNLSMSMERALLRFRSRKLKEKPSENVAKSIALMMDVDTRFFDRLGTEEKENLKAELDELIRIAETFKELL